MKTMQKRTLPDNWLEQVKSFNVEKSSLSANNKIIAKKLIHRINRDGVESLMNSLITLLIKHIVFGYVFINYDDLPIELINEALDEIKDNEKGLNLSKKIHSIFIEFITYKKLVNKGYTIKKYKREEGSCDLTMEKNDEIYNFEVKFKESKDILKSRLLDYIDGMSLLNENSFLRGNTYEIDFITEDPCDRCVKDILLEIKQFISNKSDIFKGKHINVFNTKKRREVSRDPNKVTEIIGKNYLISNELEDPKKMAELIQNFIDNGHIDTMKRKYERPLKFENFCGCLVWSIPFHKTINLKITQEEFNKFNLDFDLYVFLGGIGQDCHDFFIPKNN